MRMVIFTGGAMAKVKDWAHIYPTLSGDCREAFWPSKLGKPLWSTTTCMDKHTFCLSSAKC